jgi:nucleoid DNA-binding protein
VRGGLLGLLGLVVAVAASAQPPGRAKAPTVQSRVAAATKQKEEVVEQVLKALGPVVRDQLRAGESVTLPGLGTFRVVRVAEHRNLVDGGRVVRVPAANYVEFVPVTALNDAANAPGAQPVRTVPGFEYIPLPGANPGIKTELPKVGRTRTR